MNVAMGTSLNGIKADTNGYLYVSNFQRGGLFTKSIQQIINSGLTQQSKTPNGVYVDYKRNRLL